MKQLIYDSFLFIAQFSLSYVLIRFFPFAEISTPIAMAVAFLFAILITTSIYVFRYYQKNNTLSETDMLEGFSSASCNFGPELPKNKTCKLVCTMDGTDNNSKTHEEINTVVEKLPKLEEEVTITENFDGSINNANARHIIEKLEVLSKPEGKQTNSSCPSDKTMRDNKIVYEDKPSFGGMYYDENPYYNRHRNDDSINFRNTGDNGDNYTNHTYPPNSAENTFIGNRSAASSEREMMLLKQIEENNARIRTLEQQHQATSLDGYDSRYQTAGPKSSVVQQSENQRISKGTLDDELPYSDYNHLPVASGYKSHAYEYGYSFLPPEKWYPQPPRAPVCVTEKRCPVCPVYAEGSPIDVKEFHTSRRIMPPDNINIDYIKDKLNSGR